MDVVGDGSGEGLEVGLLLDLGGDVAPDHDGAGDVGARGRQRHGRDRDVAHRAVEPAEQEVLLDQLTLQCPDGGSLLLRDRQAVLAERPGRQLVGVPEAVDLQHPLRRGVLDQDAALGVHRGHALLHRVHDRREQLGLEPAVLMRVRQAGDEVLTLVAADRDEEPEQAEHRDVALHGQGREPVVDDQGEGAVLGEGEEHGDGGADQRVPRRDQRAEALRGPHRERQQGEGEGQLGGEDDGETDRRHHGQCQGLEPAVGQPRQRAGQSGEPAVGGEDADRSHDEGSAEQPTPPHGELGRRRWYVGHRREPEATEGDGDGGRDRAGPHQRREVAEPGQVGAGAAECGGEAAQQSDVQQHLGHVDDGQHDRQSHRRARGEVGQHRGHDQDSGVDAQRAGVPQQEPHQQHPGRRPHQ